LRGYLDELADVRSASLSVAFERRLSNMLGLFEPALIHEDALGLLTGQLGFDAAWVAERCAGGAQIRYTNGTTPHLRGLTLRTGCGLGGKVFACGRPEVVDDYLSAAAITHDYDGAVAREGIHAMIAAPLYGSEGPVGVLLAGWRDERSAGDTATSLVETVARHAAHALNVGTYAEQAAAEAARGEGARVARQLNDSVGALLAAIGSEARDLRERPDVVDSVRERLSEVERKAGEASGTLLATMRSLGISGDRDLPGAARRAVTSREHDVLRLVTSGKTNVEIAAAMTLSPNTVKTYLRSLMQKLGARNRVEAISRGRDIGLLP